MPLNRSSRTTVVDAINFSAMYTLYIFDEKRGVTAIPSAGFLGSYIGYVFGMYEPQAYTPLPSITIFDYADVQRIHVLFAVMRPRFCQRVFGGGVWD